MLICAVFYSPHWMVSLSSASLVSSKWKKYPHFACAPFHQPLNLTTCISASFISPLAHGCFLILYYALFLWMLCRGLALGLSVDSLTVTESLMHATRLWAVFLWDNSVLVILYSDNTCFGFFTWPLVPFVKCSHLVNHTAFALEFLKASLKLTYIFSVFVY